MLEFDLEGRPRCSLACDLEDHGIYGGSSAMVQARSGITVGGPLLLSESAPEGERSKARTFEARPLAVDSAASLQSL